MDEKIARLRDIFLDVSGEVTITERQEEARGSLRDGAAVDDRLRAIVERMRARYAFRTSLSVSELVTVVRGFYAGHSDAAIARDLGDESSGKTVARARLDLHLVHERDVDAPFDLDALRRATSDDRSATDIAAEFGVSASTVRHYQRVLEVQAERRMIGDRYREEFERVLEDRELSDRLTADIQHTGLEDATEGMESNVSF